MNTPIVNFINDYIARDTQRCHMPGHKGMPLLGFEDRDITEFSGADSLYEASGIIKESEQNASSLFECYTLYSTEGSSQCIRAMLYLVCVYAKAVGKPRRIMAGRNAHAVFVSAAAWLNMEVEWLIGGNSYLSCEMDPAAVEQAIADNPPAALYITSPDYLGHITDIAGIAAVCRKYGVLLLVDNAHGAYLKFLEPSRHPNDLGADLCCDSAHKTLPALTGGAYLHIGNNAPELFRRQAKRAMALFGSTSPSYLILQSLDLVNRYLVDGYGERLGTFIRHVAALKAALTASGYVLVGDEPLKVTIHAKAYGYRGDALAAVLEQSGVMCEFFDPDFTVLMLTPENGDLHALQTILLSVPPHKPLDDQPPSPFIGEQVMSVRDALLGECEIIPVKEAVGRVLASATVGCPPAIPIVLCGERIDSRAVDSFAYYGIDHCAVVKE